MSKQMTEAARLYWKDLDVLEHARQEFADYLEFVQHEWSERVDQLWRKNPRTAALGPPRGGEAKQNPGYWWLGHPDSSATGVYIEVRDPRRLETTKDYAVQLAISKKSLKKLSQPGKAILERLGEVARTSGLDLSWSDSTALSVERISLNPDDATDTAEQLAATIYQYLQVLTLIEEKFKEIEMKAQE